MLIQKFAKTRSFLIALSAFSIFSVGHMFYDLTNKFKVTGQIQNGLQICSSRVNQTYTATVIGDAASSYLDSNFTSQTTECFAEVVTLVENFKSLSNNVLKKLNNLNSNVHWFHEALRSSGNGFNVKETDNSKTLGNKYQVVESEANSISEIVDSKLVELDASLFNLKLALFVSGVVLIVCGLWEVFERRKLEASKKEVEDEALSHLISDDHATASKVEEIIVGALELNEMVHCSKLLTTYRQNVIKSFESLSTYTPALELKKVPMTMITGADSEKIEEKLNQLWNIEEGVTSDTQEITSCEVQSIAAKMIDHVSNKLIAEGIIVDMNLQESNIFGENESIEQAMYYVISDALKNTQVAADGDKKITLTGKALGSVYNFEVISNGVGREGVDITTHELIKELLNESNSRVEFSNYYNENREISGRKSRIVFKTMTVSSEDTKTITRVEKGTKKQILERLSSV